MNNDGFGNNSKQGNSVPIQSVRIRTCQNTVIFFDKKSTIKALKQIYLINPQYPPRPTGGPKQSLESQVGNHHVTCSATAVEQQ